ncbi:MAG: hypothetical protein ACRDNT_21300 [Streptosporangiaceae bacterium]
MRTRKGIGGVAREFIPPDTPGIVTSAPFLGPPTVTFTVEDWWHGRREIPVEVYPGGSAQSADRVT